MEQYFSIPKNTLNKPSKNLRTNSSGTLQSSRVGWIKEDNYEPLDLCIRSN